MKKVSGFSRQVTGCNFKIQNWSWSSIGYQVLAIGVIIFLSGLFNAGFGQQLKYHFTKGEIIDYDLITTPVKADETYGRPKTTWKYQFRVDKVSGDQYWLTMRFMGFFSDGIWISDKIATPELQYKPSGHIPDLFNVLFNIEINHPITFSMNSAGKIRELSGVDSVFNAILQQATRMPDIKRSFPYNRLESRYSKDYYMMIIQEFFPALPGSLSDTVSLHYGDRTISRVNIWNAPDLQSDSIQSYRISRAFVYQSAKKEKDFYKKNDRVSDLQLTWPRSSGYPSRIAYSGYHPEELALDASFLYSTIRKKLTNIEIINTDRTSNKSKRVQINGTLLNIGDKKVVACLVCLPGNRISKKKIPITLDPDGRFSLDFDLEVTSGQIEIYYQEKTIENLWRSPGNPNQIDLFVMGGDTVNFSVDLDKPKSLAFNCRSVNDQMVLNQLSRKFPSNDADQSMQSIQENRHYLNQKKQLLSTEFLRFMEFENQYNYLSNQVMKFALVRYDKQLNACDSLPRFIKYLDNPDGYKSDAYKEFICHLVQAYRRAKIFDNFGYAPGREDFNFAPIILNDWDLYWYQAMLAETDLDKFPEPDYEQRYLRFSDLYPGTAYQNELLQKFMSTENSRIGSTFPDFTFEDINGRKYSTKDFTDQNWILVNKPLLVVSYKVLLRNYSPSYYDVLKDTKVIICQMKDNLSEIDKLALDFKDKPIIILSGSKINDALRVYLKTLPQADIIIDRDSRIGDYSTDFSRLDIYGSWPRITTHSPKTINLTTFWFSLGGSFIIAFVIVLTIRIRAKRKEKRLTLKRRMAQLEVDAVRSRMNPHFLFNALSSIQNLINKKQIEEANLFLARFGDLVRTILTQSSKPAIGLNEEIDMIRNYLQLEQLRFPFQFEISIDPAIDTFAIEVPPLLIQPHVENAVMHGISSLGTNGKIEVSFTVQENHLICKVTDNGPGYHPGTTTGNGGLGQGWKLTRQRIQLMKEQYGDDVSVEVLPVPDETADSKESSGTTVIFRLPMQKPD